MSARWIRIPPEPRHDVAAALAAGVLAVGVGVVTFWLARLVLARERLPGGEETARGASPDDGPGGSA